jgi:hypothetical protein
VCCVQTSKRAVIEIGLRSRSLQCTSMLKKAPRSVTLRSVSKLSDHSCLQLLQKGRKLWPSALRVAAHTSEADQRPSRCCSSLEHTPGLASFRKQGIVQSNGMRPAVVALLLAFCLAISSVSHAQTADLPRPQGRPAADESDADLPPYPEHAPPRPSGEEYKDQDHFWCASCDAVWLYIHCTPW